MKKYFTLLLLLFPPILHSQVKPDIFDKLIVVNYSHIDTTNVEIKAMVKVWTSYLKSRLYGWVEKNDTLGARFWNNEEKQLTASPDHMCSLYPWLYYFPTSILNVEPFEDHYFRILNCNTETDSTGNIDIKAIYYVLVKKIQNEYKLFNYFCYEKEKLDTTNVGMVQYYYPHYYRFSGIKARKFIEFQDSLSKLFDLPLRDKLTYIVDTNNVSLISHFGCVYLKTYYTNKTGQYWKESHKLLSSFDENDHHELVHYFICTRYPDNMQFFSEGFATYLGGSQGYDLKWHVNKLCTYILSKNSDTTRIMSHPRLDQETDPFYITGGIIIKYAVDNYGFQKALKLLTYSDKQYTPEAVIEKELGIPESKLNSFLLDYINKHKEDNY